MAWLKASDTAATHPVVLRGGIGGDDRQTNEVFGFVQRCAIQSAAHLTDYWIDEGTACLFGGAHTERLIDAATRAGYWKPAEKGGRTGWLLIDDEGLWHIRLRDEVEWDRQRGRDASNPTLTAAVRYRDGDVCRYCARTVNWNDRKSTRGGTYDHRQPGQPATLDTYVVACKGCNSARKADPAADRTIPLLPPPRSPYYGEKTAAWLEQNGHRVTAGPPAAPGTPPPIGDPIASSEGTPRSEAPDERARIQRTTAPTRTIQSDLAQGRISRFPGTGRDLGQVGSGLAGSGADPPSPQDRRRRSRRHRRPPRPPPGADP